jgi:phosphoenolpyruvate phosphomutase
MGAHNALGARMAELVGFEGVWASSLEISASFGVPDASILTMTELHQAAQSMVGAITIPVVADCDSGFGNETNVMNMVRKYEAAGVAAICIEDQRFPKLNSLHHSRHDLAPVAEFAAKIRAAASARQNADFMIIARVEALIAGYSLSEALDRGHQYVDAGADAVLIHSKEATTDQVAAFASAWDGHAPLVVVPTTYYSAHTAELQALGIKMVIYANQGIRAAVRAMLEVFEMILASGSTRAVEDRIAPLGLIFALQEMAGFHGGDRLPPADGDATRRGVSSSLWAG